MQLLDLSNDVLRQIMIYYIDNSKVNKKKINFIGSLRLNDINDNIDISESLIYTICKGPNGQIVCKNNKIDILLSINDENVNYVDEDGDTFLIHFCRYNIPELSNNLLVLDSKPEQVNKNNLTALLWACRYRMHILALNILNYECNPGQADDNGCTALMYACKFKMSEVALKILNFKCKGTALAVTGLTRVREQDPSIDVRQVGKFDSGLDPLSYTVAGKPEQVSNIGYTALMYACSNNMYEVALKILNFDCKTEQVGNDGYTALIYACEYNMPELAFKILNREYDSTPH